MLKHLIVLAVLAAPAWTYSHGAPKEICYREDDRDFYPHHHSATAQTSPPPFKIKGPTSVAAGSTISLKLTGHKPIKGFIIQARVDGKPVGSFESHAHSQVFDCLGGGDTLTHTRIKGHVDEIDFEWTAPQDLGGKTVYFVATVVKTKLDFWVKTVTKKVQITPNGIWQLYDRVVYYFNH